MSLKNLILGYLEKPASGYDIKRSIDESLSHLWAAESSQVYSKLRAMEKQGLLKSTKEKSSKGPDRRVYRRTREGEKTFTDWLESDPELSHERLSVLAQLHFLSRSRNHEQTTTLLEGVRDRFVERLEKYKALEAAESRKADEEGDEFFDKLALDLSVRTLQARIEWCNDAIGQLKQLSPGEPKHA